MLQIKFGYDWPTGCRDIQVWKCLQTDRHTDRHTDRRRLDWYTISSPLSLRLRWAKKNSGYFFDDCYEMKSWTLLGQATGKRAPGQNQLEAWFYIFGDTLISDISLDLQRSWMCFMHTVASDQQMIELFGLVHSMLVRSFDSEHLAKSAT